MWLLLILSLILGSASAQSPLARTAIGQRASNQVDYSLPTNLRPSLYEIELEPNFLTDTFNGSVRITISVESATHEIVLHCRDLEIDAGSIKLLDENDNVVNSISGTTYSNDDRQFYTIAFEESLVEGNTYVLTIGAFTGILNLLNDGFYLAKYIADNGDERKLATTQFEATSARRAFPSFDEPALKANFDITLIRPAGYDSISNSPKISTNEISPGRFQDKFGRTVKMSTYLVAFVVSDFTYVSDLNQKVYLRPALTEENRGDYALKTAVDVLHVIAEFLNVPYSLEKMDQIGLPDGYFSAGAMENWGLVTYRELYLSYAERITASNYKEFIATVIAHEFGHQWFGNLVSPQWWTYLWLNEGFATYFEHYGASVVYPDMELMEQMLIKSVQYALNADATPNTRPMNYDVGSPTDISSIFDTVAYDKSGAVIRMVEAVLSTEVFRNGLNNYLNKMQYKAAQPEDLYTSWQGALDEANLKVLPEGEDVSTVLHTWDSNAGYPMITVTRNYTDGSVTFGQRRFLTTDPNNNDESIWYVPVSYTSESTLDFVDVSPKFWLTIRSLKTDLEDLKANDWLLVNVQERGYYRVNYDTENWNLIIDFLTTENFNQINKLNRAQLLDDSYILARYGVIDYTILLRLTEYIVRETDYIPLYPFFTFLTFLNPYMANTEEYEKFENYILTILEAAVESVGFDEQENDRHVTKLNRISVLTWACRFGRQDCREYALGRLREWAQDEEKLIAPDLQTPLICAALRIGEVSDFDFVYRRYLSESDAYVQARILNGLGCSENDEVLNKYISILLDPESGWTYSNRLTAWSTIINSGNYGRDFVYNYIKTNWSAINLSIDASELNMILTYISMKLSTQEQYEDMYAFSQEVNSSAYGSALRQILTNIDWSNENLPTILAWLNSI